MSEAQVCRTCLKFLVSESRYVTLDVNNATSSEIKSKLESCIPEMTINAVKNPVICLSCVQMLNASFHFKRQCIKTEEVIYEYLLDCDNDIIDLRQMLKDKFQVKIIPSDVGIKEETLDTITGDEQSNVVGNACTHEIFPASEQSAVTCRVPTAAGTSEVPSVPELCLVTEVSSVPESSVVLEASEAVCISRPPDASPDMSDAPEEITLTPFSIQLTRCDEEYNRSSAPAPLKKRRMKAKLKRQVRTIPKIKRVFNYTCQLCELEIGSNLAQHMFMHRKQKVVYRYHAYNGNEAQKVDILLKNDRKRNRFQCAVCPESRSSVLNILTHMKLHASFSPNLIYRTRTVKKSRERKKLGLTKNKSRSQNNLVKTLTCSICKFITANKTTFKDHENTHTNPLRYKCFYCNFTTDLVTILKEHNVKHHINSKTFKCIKCDYVTEQWRSLKYHSFTHTNLPLYKCAFCEYISIKRKDFVDHVRIHEKRCGQCYYVTRDEHNFYEHLKQHE